ncbi:MAG TPA: inositol monophosphatase [Dehalococcoidia bacterium]|nr:inositol monophosphatase [Dehalococcoidia bacterium]HIK89638.1 inositol monophosphatase [Dehalococcoidia bacterium]
MTESPQQSASAGFTDAELEHIEKSVVRAAMEAGEFVASRFGGVLEISNKGDKPGKDLVTDVDKASQRLIGEIMAETCPDHLLLGEEDPPDEEPDAADWLWVVDPIDGTTNFVNSSLIHAVSVAALYKGTPVAAAMRIPWSNDDGYLLMHARKGNGSWIDGSRVHVRPSSDSGVPVAGVHAATPRWFRRAFHILKPLQGNLGELRDGGSTCYDQFMVARGSMQYAITGVAFTWDFAAGMLLTKESGGKVMILGSNRKFKEFNGWGEGYANDSATYGRIRKWKGLILSGAPETVDFVAANLGPHMPGLLRKLKSLFS